MPGLKPSTLSTPIGLALSRSGSSFKMVIGRIPRPGNLSGLGLPNITNRFGVVGFTMAEEEGEEPSSAGAGPSTKGAGQPSATTGKASGKDYCVVEAAAVVAYAAAAADTAWWDSSPKTVQNWWSSAPAMTKNWWSSAPATPQNWWQQGATTWH
jgi:hypothetical protein